MPDHPTFQMSADARMLLQRLRQCSIGDTVTYAQLAAVISRPVSGSFGALRTALRRVLKDEDMVFACVRGVGFKRLDHHEIVAQGASAAEAMRRAARRSIERQLKADFAKLSREDQNRVTAQLSIMGTVAMMTKPKSVERLAGTATPGTRDLPIAETLRMFAGQASSSNKE